ncbi:hypothetical protein BDN67DRAFT_453696 [Paxillus ammoniavirescens]|nr:hypothetical protein BDN67DRAFT_453696 [Paxillus ammoniavirescens]
MRKIVGVLNDCDLASLASRRSPLGNERTGAIPFMAIDLLGADGQDGEVKHLYRHDMESFIWAFIWVSCQYKSGQPRSPGPLDVRAKVDASRCVETKRSFLANPQVPDDMDNNGKVLVMNVVIFLRHRLNTRDGFKIAKQIAQWALGDAKPSTSMKQLKDEIERLDGNLVEESEDVVFANFTLQIGVHKEAIEAKVLQTKVVCRGLS